MSRSHSTINLCELPVQNLLRHFTGRLQNHISQRITKKKKKFLVSRVEVLWKIMVLGYVVNHVSQEGNSFHVLIAPKNMAVTAH